MKKILYAVVFSFVFLISLNQVKAQAGCWANQTPYTTFWDSCSNNKASLNAYITFKVKGCFKYEWTVNGTLVDSSYLLHYNITKNGTYNVCIKIKDTCNNCDTSICSKRTITCFSSTCNWANRYGKVNNFDSCSNNAASLNAYIYFNYGSASCFKYEWTVNGSKVSSGTNYPYYIKYQITQNGTYDLCVKVSDTCNNCDTTFCSKRTITCFASTCNWAVRNPYSYFFDSCTANAQSLNGYITFKNYSTSCFKYKWTVNGSVVDSTHYILNYKLSQNGTYDVCVKIIDTCNNCDTSICSKRTITCFSSTCNWANRYGKVNNFDSCSNNAASLNAYIYFNYGSASCFKYEWTVNGSKVSSGTNYPYYIKYQITQNGTYDLCVKVSDTCNNCDTTFCSKRTISCFGSSSTCNWANRSAKGNYKDSCNSKSASLAAYISFSSITNKSCFKYQWTVNGNNVGTNSYYINYTVTQNGTYNLCVKVTDTCNNCDTTICSSRIVKCIGSSTCNWANRYPTAIFKDTCKSTSATLNGYISFNSSKNCFKYQWSVDGTDYGLHLNYFSFTVKYNGTYNICVKVTDTCNNCDTTFCSTRVINCLSACNWASKSPKIFVWDSCKTGIPSVNAYISFKVNGCFKYQWTVNGSNAGNLYYTKYAITQNGTYKVCVKVTDTCNNCDTTICSSITVNCNNSINNIDLNEGIKLYPNPTQGIVKLDWNLGNSSYVIYNIAGQSLFNGNLSNGTQTLDLTSYPTGLYILQVRTANANLTQKIFLQKE